MNFKSEVIAFKGFFGAKKFYGLGIIWKEGTFYDVSECRVLDIDGGDED